MRATRRDTGDPAIKIPSGVWVLGFVSMFMDISSEMIHSLLPMFLMTTLGASAFAVGLIEDFVAAYGPDAKPFVWRKREVKGSQLRNTSQGLRP